jgi:hypothetical protein
VEGPTEKPTGKRWDEGNWFALALGILLAFLWGPLLGFYMGTVFGSDHFYDLQHQDMLNGLKGAGIGFVVGVCGLLYILKVYPSRTKKDFEDWKEENSHHRFSGHH